MNEPYYRDEQVTLHLGDSLDVLPTLPDASVDAIVCDPPYGLAELSPGVVTQAISAWVAGDRSHVPTGRGGFMGRDWDRFVPPPGVWDECLRVLKPGGHLAAFAGSRTVDLMGLAIRLAGFELRDSLMWHHGSGFPKSLDVSKAIDKAAGAEREVVGTRLGQPGYSVRNGIGLNSTMTDDNWKGVDAEHGGLTVTAPATPDAARWSGWGTALKPAHEPIVLARKPLAGTVARNVLEHGTGALNIDKCRIDTVDALVRPAVARTDNAVYGKGPGVGTQAELPGRWPANVLLSHPPLLDDHGQSVGDACADGCVPGCPVAEMDQQSGSGAGFGASRFFPVFRYQAKAPACERPRGGDGATHPTVKPLALMQWLVRLVTPPGGLVLDPFAGSGTTLEAAALEGFRAVGIEQHEPYAELCRVRLSKPMAGTLFGDIA